MLPINYREYQLRNTVMSFHISPFRHDQIIQ